MLPQDKNKWYVEQLTANGLKVLSPTDSLQGGLRQIGERLTAEWLVQAGAVGQSILDEYKGRFRSMDPVPMWRAPPVGPAAR